MAAGQARASRVTGAAGGHVPVAEVVRGGFVEGVHHGSVVAVDGDGQVLFAVGAPDAPMLPRSCLKPLQAVAMVRAGLSLRGDMLALAAASHSGEPFHLDGVRRILAEAGLDEGALRATARLPLDDVAAHALIAAGGGPSPLAADCSGKHAAMLLTSHLAGWPLDSYLEADHPVQRAIAATVAELTDVPTGEVFVDGCGAPLLPTTLTGLARAFSRIATAETAPERAVARSIRSYPEWVSGTRRDECDLLGAVPGAIAKAGAEGCYAVALPDGRAVAVKIADGHPRARRVTMLAALRRLGVDNDPAVDAGMLAATGTVPVLGGGRPVGEVRPTW